MHCVLAAHRQNAAQGAQEQRLLDLAPSPSLAAASRSFSLAWVDHSQRILPRFLERMNMLIEASRLQPRADELLAFVT